MGKIIQVILSVLLFAGFGNAAMAENKESELKTGAICGRVIDNSKQGLPGACVYVDGLQTADVSDVNGFYSIRNLKPGHYKVIVSYIGYDLSLIHI